MTATPLDAVPDISDVQVIVSTEWMGRSPDIIKDQITYPIVTALLSARRVRTVRGFTDFGISYVYVGCIPSKALLAATEARHIANARPFPGIEATPSTVDMAALVGSKDTIVRDLRQSKYVDLSREYDWEIVRGTARFASGPALEVNGRTIEAEHSLIATGSTPSVARIDGLTYVPYLTSTSAMELREVPESLVVVGGNYIGLELGQLFARLGTRVTIIEALERIAPREEPEISDILADVLREEGVIVRTGATVSRVRQDDRRSATVTP